MDVSHPCQRTPIPTSEVGIAGVGHMQITMIQDEFKITTIQLMGLKSYHWEFMVHERTNLFSEENLNFCASQGVRTQAKQHNLL